MWSCRILIAMKQYHQRPSTGCFYRQIRRTTHSGRYLIVVMLVDSVSYMLGKMSGPVCLLMGSGRGNNARLMRSESAP